jgi:TetR/AcrR family transcriptional repressor of bet genes
MPKQVDHEQRRRHIAEAVWEIVALQGLDAVSFRDVAASAGISMGQVQHYFATKTEIILFAARYLVELANAGAQALGAAAASLTPLAAVRVIAEQTLVTGTANTAGAAVWHAFVTKAATMPELAAVMTETWRGAQALLTEQIRLAQSTGEVDPALDPALTASGLHALIDGLAPQILLGHHTSAEAMKIVDAHLAQLH